MPTGDLDMPLRPSAEQIRRQAFATVRRGYDPEQVRAYLISISNQVGTLERELRRLTFEVESAAVTSEQMADPVTTSDPPSPPEDPYDALSKRFATLIEMADQEAEKILENARSEAKRALDEATSEADRIRVDAQAHAEEARQEVADLVERATTESDRVISGLAERRRSLFAQLEEMRGKLIAVAQDLAVPIDEDARVEVDDTEVAGASDDDQPAAADEAADAETPVAPRYEDLWVEKEESLQIPDLTSLDRDLKDRDK
jgi:DivIVA domain-containing protein